MYFNVREKSFPDGLIQATRYEQYRYKGKRRNLTKRGGPAMHGSGATIERKEYENMKRARQVVWDLARANVFNYWCTLTFSDEQVEDRRDYKCSSGAMKKFTNVLTHMGCRYLFVPDLHEDGAYHFHGLVAGPLKLTRAINPHTGKPLFDNHGRPCYNIDDWNFGFSSVVPLDGSDAVVGYLASYYTKNRKMIVPKGCKCYWASRNLARPEVSYGDQDIMSFLRSRYVGAEYTKAIHSRFGKSIFVQTTEEQIAAQVEKWGKQTEADAAPEDTYWKEDWDGTYSTQQNKENIEVLGLFD